MIGCSKVEPGQCGYLYGRSSKDAPDLKFPASVSVEWRPTGVPHDGSFGTPHHPHHHPSRHQVARVQAIAGSDAPIDVKGFVGVEEVVDLLGESVGGVAAESDRDDDGGVGSSESHEPLLIGCSSAGTGGADVDFDADGWLPWRS